MNEALKKLLKALSNPEEELDVIKSRQLMDLKKLDPFKHFYRTIDYKIYNGDHQVPTRIYFPSEESFETVNIEEYQRSRAHIDMGKMVDNTHPVLLFFHGGGFATESVESYNRICWNMAKATGHVVVSVNYRLAPEHRFPAGLMDCYAVAKAVFQDQTILQVKPERITVIGDSAGGNLAAAVCQMARDRGDFAPQRQILIYPCLNSDYSDDSPYASVRENGRDYLLTQRDMIDYLELYQSSPEDRQNPYFAPLEARDYSNLPRTLVLTGEFDPLRDEGEEYARRIRRAGGWARSRRIADGVHGFLMMPLRYPAVKELYEQINDFLKEVSAGVSDTEKQMEKSGKYSQDIPGYQQR